MPNPRSGPSFVRLTRAPSLPIEAPTTPSLPTIPVSIASPVFMTASNDTIPLRGK